MSSITSIVSNATSKGYKAPTQYQTWQPASTKAMDTAYSDAMNQNIASNNATQGDWTSYLNNVENNPYSAGAQTAADQAGGMYGALSKQDTSNANALSQAGNQMLAAGQQAYNTSFDPQNSMYNLMASKNRDKANAQLASMGLGNSAAGAGLANDAASNFDMNWMNTQQQRQLAGLDALSGANASGQQSFAGANSLGTAGANEMMQSGQLPYSMYNDINNNFASGLGIYGEGATAINNQNISNIIPYLSLGAQQSNTQGNFDNGYWKNSNAYTGMRNAQNAAMWGSIGGAFDAAGFGLPGENMQKSGASSWMG